MAVWVTQYGQQRFGWGARLRDAVGLRASDVVSLRLSDLDWKRRCLRPACACLPDMLYRAGLRGAQAVRDPRIHDLRHTFADRSLKQCSHDRTAVARHVVALRTYLGDAHVTDTYWYLQATPVLMGQVAEPGEALLVGGTA
jgi:integrase